MRAAREKYIAQKHHAKYRGIPFRFTYKQWLAWWEGHLGPNWIEKRGRFGHEYCMARPGDQGAYEPGNVACVLTEQNCREAASNRLYSAAPNAKLTAKWVLEIWHEEGSYSAIGRRYGVTAGTISAIKQRKTWRSVTKGLR